MRTEQKQLGIALLLAVVWAGAQSACAAVKHAPASAISARDAAWTRAYAAPGTPAVQPSEQKDVGEELRLVTDPRFSRLLRASFPQRQWFWYDHWKFTPLPDLIYDYLSTDGNAILDQNHYVTADGCMIGICTHFRGMLWIDTRQNPAVLIFAATEMVNGNAPPFTSHLWIFSSKKLGWSQLPSPFLMSVHRWLNTFNNSTWNKYGNPFDFAMATLVEPNGQMIELAPSALNVPKNDIATKSGAGL